MFSVSASEAFNMGVNRKEYVADLCKAHGKVVPSDDELPQTTISTDLKAFVLSLVDAPKTKPKKSSEENGKQSKSNKKSD